VYRGHEVDAVEVAYFTLAVWQVVANAGFNGTVKFVNCIFFGTTLEVVRMYGTGSVTFESYQFHDWDFDETGYVADGVRRLLLGILLVLACVGALLSRSMGVRYQCAAAVSIGQPFLVARRSGCIQALQRYCLLTISSAAP
jgi:hypothetical protein